MTDPQRQGPFVCVDAAPTGCPKCMLLDIAHVEYPFCPLQSGYPFERLSHHDPPLSFLQTISPSLHTTASELGYAS